MQHDGRSPGGHPPDTYVMQARIEQLYQAIADVKTLLRNVEETVSVIKVFDLRIQQQSLDLTRLETDVREYKRLIEDLEERLDSEIEDAKTEASAKIGKVSTLASNTKSTLDRKVSYVQGALAAITALGAILYVIAVWWGSRYIDKADDSERYIHTLRTLDAEQHLKDSMGNVEREKVDPQPKVVEPEKPRKL